MQRNWSTGGVLEHENQDPAQGSYGRKVLENMWKSLHVITAQLRGRRLCEALNSMSLTYYNIDSPSREARPR